MSFPLSWATFVVKWPQNEVPILEVDKEISISKFISFCLRFQWQGILKNAGKKKIICSAEENSGKLCLYLKLSLNEGFVSLNENDLIFEIPETKAHPFAWHHFCFSSDDHKYQVIFSRFFSDSDR